MRKEFLNTSPTVEAIRRDLHRVACIKIEDFNATTKKLLSKIAKCVTDCERILAMSKTRIECFKM